MVEEKNTSSKSDATHMSDSTDKSCTSDFAYDYNDLLELYTQNYEKSEYEILYIYKI